MDKSERSKPGGEAPVMRRSREFAWKKQGDRSVSPAEGSYVLEVLRVVDDVEDTALGKKKECPVGEIRF